MDRHADYFQALPVEDRQLVILQVVLYEGSWDEMEQDLLARREGKPFVYKLTTRIEEDLGRIRRLRAYEQENRISLGDFIPREKPTGTSGEQVT